LEQFIGLGQALRIVIVEVEWPASGRRQRFTDVPMDTTVRIVEGEASLQIVAHTPLTWALKHGSATHEGMH